ncbi:PfkB family carbohydrate kinase [Pseudonocardia saturnea]
MRGKGRQGALFRARVQCSRPTRCSTAASTASTSASTATWTAGPSAGALAELRADGVDTSAVAVLDGVATGMALIVVDGAGENQIAVGAGANGAVSPAAVTAALRAAPADCVLVSTEIPAPRRSGRRPAGCAS